MFTAPQITWHGAGRPALVYDVTTHHGHCATCGAAIDGVAVHIKEIECPTLTQHADFIAHGQHVCPACAWLYGAGKGKPGNFIATPDKYEQAVISLSSVVEDKRPWLTIIREIAKLPSDTPVCGVLTTDVKPRLWPRMQAATAWFDRQFNAAFDAIKVAGHIVGMRAGESQRRAWNILKRGVHYQRQDGRRMLLPLAGWSGKDVWAYTATHNLPYLRIYDHATYDRDRQRSEIAMSNPGSQRLHAHGEFQAWQMCYPAEFQAWCDRWPELAYS